MENKRLQVEYIPLSEIKPYEKNPRKNDKAVEIVAKSISQFGFNVPILLDRTNTIIAGHTRLKAAIKLGLQEAPVIWIDDLTEEQVKAFRIMDNKSSEYAIWDIDLLTQELTNLKDMNFDLNFTGFSEVELSKLILESIPEEELPNLENPKYQIKIGEIWQLGNHRLMCGDSTNEQMVNQLMNNEKADLLLTDPPYGIDIVKDNHKIGYGDGRLGFKSSIKNTGTIGAGNIVPVNQYSKIHGDNKPFEPQFLLNNGKNQIIWGGNYFASKLKDTSCWIIWDKREDIPSNNFADCEIAWTSYDKPSRIYRQLWSGLLRKGGRDEELTKRCHPTQKPVGIHIKILQDYSQENNNILDLYGGSGTTLIACEQTKRKCFMMEIDPKYCSVIIERWEKFTGKQAVKL